MKGRQNLDKIVLQCIWLVSMVMIFQSCSPPRVSSFTNEEAQFEAYGTYNIESQLENLEDVSEDAKQITSRMNYLISREMDSRNYIFKKYSDVTVFYQIVVQETVDYDVNRATGYNTNYYRMRPYDYTYLTERIRKEGVLIIDIKETYTERLVWQGSLKLTYARNSDHPLEESVRTIFAAYPYTANNPEPKVINQ